MLSLPNAAALRDALEKSLDTDLHALLAERLDQIEAQDLGELTHILVVQPDHTELEILAELGWSPLVHPIDGTRYGEQAFEPYWAWLRDLGGWYELIQPVGNNGFAYILLIEKRCGTLPELLSMCAEGGAA